LAGAHAAPADWFPIGHFFRTSKGKRVVVEVDGWTYNRHGNEGPDGKTMWRNWYHRLRVSSAWWSLCC
jgi:hypothetical protein